ncbi:MAG: hypothetical protein ABIO24_05215, partial [Saprospiraceae bacterium]
NAPPAMFITELIILTNIRYDPQYFDTSGTNGLNTATSTRFLSINFGCVQPGFSSPPSCLV